MTQPADSTGADGAAGAGSAAAGLVRTLTKHEADQRAEQHIRAAVAALPRQPALTLFAARATEVLDPTDGGPLGRYEVSRVYWLDELPTEDNEAHVAVLRAHWLDNGFRLLADTSTGDLFTSVESAEDAFRMSIRARDDGRLSIGASSPAVWPDGFPPDEKQGAPMPGALPSNP